MKETMKILLKKDIKALLPGFAMLFVAGIVLCVMCLFGIFTGNGNFTVTAVYLYFIALIPVFAYTVIKGANLYRQNLSDSNYLNSLAERNIKPASFIMGKMLWSWAMGAVLVTEYLMGSLAMTVLAFKLLPAEYGSQGFVHEFEDAFVSLEPLNLLALFAAMITVTAGLTAMTYLAFELCYMYFIRGKYSFIASVMTLFCIFWIVWKIFDFTVPQKGIMSTIGTALYGAVIGIICVIIHLLTASRKIYKNAEEK